MGNIPEIQNPKCVINVINDDDTEVFPVIKRKQSEKAKAKE